MNRPSTVGAWLAEAARRLGADRPEGALEARLLLQSVLTVPPAHLLANPGRPLTVDEEARLDRLVAERLRGTPVQHLTGRAPFRHLELVVGEGVFVPRPETEGLVERVLDHLRSLPASPAGPLILELGTGSGAISLSLLHEFPAAAGCGVELSEPAARCTERNLLRLPGAAAGRYRLHRGDLFAALAGREVPESFDVIVSNPPYIPDGRWGTLPREVRVFESPLALLGGRDGTDTIARIVTGAPGWIVPGGLLALEIDESHGEAVRRILEADGRWEGIRIEADLAGRTRYALAARRRR